MASELADLIDGTPGRFVPEEMRGRLVEAEHLTRYWWAQPLARRGRVLDAGCGMGYGTLALAEAGASEAVGVDVAAEVVEAARAASDGKARFEEADVGELPFADDSFDVVVCFEVIEHLDDQARALDEFRRVLADGGVLAISSPNPDVYVAGNPHHTHELRPAELRALLAGRFANVRLVEQHNHVASTVLPDDEHDAPHRALLRRVPGEPLDGTTYTLGLAGDAPLPELPPLVTLSSPLEIREWVERFTAQQDHIGRQAQALDVLRRRAEAQSELERRLAEAESAAAEIPALRARADELAVLAADLERARAVIRDLQSSLSWRVTAPLRSLKSLSRARRPSR